MIYLPSLKPLKKLFGFQPIEKTILLQIDFEKHIWITAYDIEIPVKQMTTEHINNCIACWEGRGNMRIPDDYLGGKEKWLKIFNDELISRQ